MLAYLNSSLTRIYFFLYVVASQQTVGMVLVQEDDELHENVIYYLSQNIINAELRYNHVEKLDLATIHATQRLRHYILPRQTMVIDHISPFQFVLTKRMIGENIMMDCLILQ